jgi:hypothetical protein
VKLQAGDNGMPRIIICNCNTCGFWGRHREPVHVAGEEAALVWTAAWQRRFGLPWAVWLSFDAGGIVRQKRG